jgi:hypothetical protein
MLQPPVRLANKNPKTMIFFAFLFSTTYLIQFFIVFPSKSHYSYKLIGLPYQWLIVNTVVTALTVFFYLLCSFIGPGYI